MKKENLQEILRGILESKKENNESTYFTYKGETFEYFNVSMYDFDNNETYKMSVEEKEKTFGKTGIALSWDAECGVIEERNFTNRESSINKMRNFISKRTTRKYIEKTEREAF